MRHRYFTTARQAQVDEANIAETARNISRLVRRGKLAVAEGIEALRAAGMFEAEIEEVLA